VLLLNFMEVIVVRRQIGCQDSIRSMFKEEGLQLLTKGIAAKMLHAIAGGTLFYLSMNKIEKYFDVNLSDDAE